MYVPDIPGAIFIRIEDDCLKRGWLHAIEEQQGDAAPVTAEDCKVEAIGCLPQPQWPRSTEICVRTAAEICARAIEALSSD
jgi:hypothetical protein